jgi:hypothetical protein
MGKINSHQSKTPYYSDFSYFYSYRNDQLAYKKLEGPDKTELHEFTYKEGRVDSIYLYELAGIDTLLTQLKKIVWLDKNEHLISTTRFESSETALTREIYNSLGIKIDDLSTYDHFFHAFHWPDTSAISQVENVDTLSIGVTLRLRARFNTGSRDFLITRNSQNEIVFFGHYIPGTSYGTTTFIEEQNDGRIKKHGQFRLNSEKDTVWVGVHVMRFDQRDRLRNRLVYKGKESAENLVRDVVFTYTDTSVISIREYYDENIGVNYKHTVERPSLFSNYMYLENTEIWNPVLEAWEVYLEIKRKYDNNWQEIYFSDLNKEIIRKFNNDAVCIEEQILYSDGRLPESWWMEIEYWSK